MHSSKDWENVLFELGSEGVEGLVTNTLPWNELFEGKFRFGRSYLCHVAQTIIGTHIFEECKLIYSAQTPLNKQDQPSRTSLLFRGAWAVHLLQVSEGLNAVPMTAREKKDCTAVLSPQQLKQVDIGDENVAFYWCV